MSVPVRPERGAPCNGCGWCCQNEVCVLGEAVFGEAQAAPCPALRNHDGRFWCGVVEEAERRNVAFGAHLKWSLGIGIGCFTEPADPGPDRRDA